MALNPKKAYVDEYKRKQKIQLQEFVQNLKIKYPHHTFELIDSTEEEDKNKKVDGHLRIDEKRIEKVDLKTKSKPSFINFSIPYRENFFHRLTMEVSESSLYLLMDQEEFIIIKSSAMKNWLKETKPIIRKSSRPNDDGLYFLIPDQEARRICSDRIPTKVKFET
jgi:hypothetical protein